MRSPDTSKGQFSTFMKPIIIMIFGMLLLSLLTSTLNFNVGIQQEEIETEFQASPGEIASKVSKCLSVDKSAVGSSYLLNQSALEMAEMKRRYSEPECAENFKYGYEIGIRQKYLRGVSSGETTKAADVVFALDDSDSMDDYLNNVRQNTNEFIDELPEGSRVGMFTYASPPSSYIKNHVDLTDDASKVTSELSSISTDGGNEPEDKAIKYALNNFDYDDSKRKILVILATEEATKDTPTSKPVTEWAEEAADEDIEIYTVSGQAGAYVDIAEITDAKRFSVTADYSSIFEEIAGEDKFVGGQSACTVPPVTKYNGSAEIVVAADASEGFSDEWETICEDIENKVETMEAKGLETDVSYYSPGQPSGPTNGKASPMPHGSGSYNHTSGNIPSCVGDGSNNAETSSWGKGITEWDGKGLTGYNSSLDSGLEAWGVFSKWILENHKWNSSSEKRMMFVIGNQDPTGGDSGSEFRTKDGTAILDNETEIVRNVTNLSDKKEVTIHLLSPSDMEYADKDVFGDPDKNDAIEMMEIVEGSGSNSHSSYENEEDLPKKFETRFSGFKETATGSAGVCKNVTYSFGELRGSEDENLDDSLTVNIPASVYQSENLTTPAEMSIEVRRGALERLSGAINKVISTGRKVDENVTVYANIDNDETLQVKDFQAERRKKTLYQLQKPGGGTTLSVDDDLLVGINGRSVFRDEDGQPSNIDFSAPENQFRAYKGASIQLIGINSAGDSLGLDKIELSCVNGCPDNGQILNPEKYQASEGSERYKELGGIGPFYHNFTEIKIGKTVENTERGLCYAGSEKCVKLRTGEVEDLELRPGSHEVGIRYTTSGGVEFLE